MAGRLATPALWGRQSSVSEIDRLLAFGQEALSAAGELAAARFRALLTVENKLAGDGFDPVTEADRAVEACLRERIAAHYPHHGIVGEEFGERRGQSAWSWIIDPIDGTRSFMTGLPAWGCLLGILRDGEPAAGLMHQPVVRETFGGDGEQAWIDRSGTRQTLRASANPVVADAVLCATHPDIFDDATLKRFQALAKQVRLMRYGGDCYNYCLLAHGLVDMVIEDDIRPYDILPLVPIVRGAGASITDLAGGPAQGGRLVVAAANEALHAAAMAAMHP